MASTEPRSAAWWIMLVSALAIGLIAGFGAVVFRAMIGGIAQPSFPWPAFVRLRRQHSHTSLPVGRLDHPRARDWRHRRRLPGQDLRSRGQGARRSGGDGRDLLSGGQDPCDRGRGQVGRLGTVDRQRRVGRSGGADHPDRRRIRLDRRRDHRHAGSATSHPHRCRSRRRHCSHVQHADRRHRVRHRADAAVREPHELAVRRCVLRDGDLHRPTFFGVLPSFNVPALAVVEGPGVPLAVFPWFVLFGTSHGRDRVGDDARHLLVRGPLRRDAGQLLHAAHVRHAAGRVDHLRLHDAFFAAGSDSRTTTTSRGSATPRSWTSCAAN